MTLLAGARAARAVPIDEPNVGGVGFSGPTTGDLAAVYWNPAALGLMRGLHVMASGTGILSRTTVDRDGGAGTGRARDLDYPFGWPLRPGSFAGVSYDVGGDRFTLAFATYLPSAERQTYEVAPGTAAPTRFHRLSADLRNLALVPALSIRFAGDFRLGFAPGFLFSTGRLVFDEPVCQPGDGACPADDESLVPAARFDLGSGFGFGASRFAVTLGAGVYFRRRAWEFGFSFSSRPLGGDVDGGVAISGERSTVVLPDGRPLQRADGTDCVQNCVFADIVYKLPYTITGAASWHVRPGTELQAIVRVLSFPANDVIDVRLTGAALSGEDVPQHVVLHRGYGTVVDARLRVASWVGRRLRLGAAVRVETAALPGRAVSPAAVDGLKLGPMAMALFSPVRHLWIGVGYGFTYLVPVSVGASSSVFDPTAARDCAARGGDLSASSCLVRLDGRARPTAAGTYRQFLHHLSLSLLAQF